MSSETDSLLGETRSARLTAAHERTLPIHWMAAALEGADGRMLGSIFRALEVEFSVTPSQLALLVVFQSLAGALSTPVWAHFADIAPSRIVLLATGVAFLGIWTVLGAVAFFFWQLLVFKALTGTALAAVSPISQSIVADIVPEQHRGFQFGIIGFSNAAGSLAGTTFATVFGTETVLGRFSGWRVVTASLGITSLLTAACIPLIATDPRQDEVGEARPVLHGLREHAREAARKAADVWKLNTFKLIVLQGVFGAVPWQALAFSTLWLQYVGLSNFNAAVVTTCGIVGNGFGNLLGGWLGDQAARRYPDTGRVRVAQTSVLMGILHTPIIFFGLPWDGDHVALYGTLFFTQALTMTWCLAGSNRPIFSELAPPSTRASLLAWDVAIEGTSAALFGAPLVGLLAEFAFGYDISSAPQDMDQMSPEARHSNALALGKALMLICMVAWTLCLLVWCVVAYTYPRDRAAVRAAEAEAKAKGKGIE